METLKRESYKEVCGGFVEEMGASYVVFDNDLKLPIAELPTNPKAIHFNELYHSFCYEKRGAILEMIDLLGGYDENLSKKVRGEMDQKILDKMYLWRGYELG